MKAKGFTLIELLVVITIIGILATGATALYTGSQQKARDNNRITDMMVYKTAVAQLYDDNGQEYPDSAATGNIGKQAIDNGYIEKLISDAKEGDTGANGTQVLEYRYKNGSFNGVAKQSYELSTAFEAKGNIGAKGKAQTDQGGDNDRFEIGINIDDAATDGVVTSGDATDAALKIVNA